MNNKFYPSYPISNIIPADYNPRSISPEARLVLKDSIQKFGFLKPLILNSDGTIVAGHQRHSVAKELGCKAVPAFILKNVWKGQEIRFNMQHNLTEGRGVGAYVDSLPALGYVQVKPSQIHVTGRHNMFYLSRIAWLLSNHGEWGSIIVDTSGKILNNVDYAVACKDLLINCLAFVVDESVSKEVEKFLNRDYGTYEYSHLNLNTNHQVLCQMRRSESRKSLLYETLVIPSLEKGMKILDFGAGEAYYAKKLKSQGYSIDWYEPNNREGNLLKVGKAVEQLRAIEESVKKSGLYDVVIADSVLNSIVSLDYEKWVLNTCGLLLKPEGTLWASTRALHRSGIDFLSKVTDRAERDRTVFLDKDGFSARYRDGRWTVQKFYSKENFVKCLNKYFEHSEILKANTYILMGKATKFKKPNRKEAEKALNEEFNMRYGEDNYQHNCHKTLVKLILERNYEKC